MRYRYFANVMAHADFYINASNREQADEKAREYLKNLGWEAFSEVGHEIGRFTDGVSWELVEQDGDI